MLHGLVKWVCAGTLVISLTSCGGSKLEQAVSKLCECMKPMVALMEESKKLEAESKKLADDASKVGETMTKVGELNTKLEEAQKKVEPCIKEAEALAGNLKNDKKAEEEMNAILEKKCPDVAKIMSNKQ